MRCNKESVSTPTHDILSSYTILNIKTTESEMLSAQGRGLNTTLYEYLILTTIYQERLADIKTQISRIIWNLEVLIIWLFVCIIF